MAFQDFPCEGKTWLGKIVCKPCVWSPWTLYEPLYDHMSTVISWAQCVIPWALWSHESCVIPWALWSPWALCCPWSMWSHEHYDPMNTDPMSHDPISPMNELCVIPWALWSHEHYDPHGHYMIPMRIIYNPHEHCMIHMSTMIPWTLIPMSPVWSHESCVWSHEPPMWASWESCVIPIGPMCDPHEPGVIP